MKISKQKLKQIIKEEISKVLSEGEAHHDTSTKGIQDTIDSALKLSRETYGEIDPYDVSGFLSDFLQDILPGKDMFDKVVNTIEAAKAYNMSDEDIAKEIYNLINSNLYDEEGDTQ